MHTTPIYSKHITFFFLWYKDAVTTLTLVVTYPRPKYRASSSSLAFGNEVVLPKDISSLLL